MGKSWGAVVAVAVAVAALLVMTIAPLRPAPGLTPPAWWGLLVILGVGIAVTLARLPLLTEGRPFSFYFLIPVLGAAWVLWGPATGLWVSLGVAAAQLTRRLLHARHQPADGPAYLQSVTDVLALSGVFAALLWVVGPFPSLARFPVLWTVGALAANLLSLGLLLFWLPEGPRRRLVSSRAFWQETFGSSLLLDIMGLALLTVFGRWGGVVGWVVAGGSLVWITRLVRTALLVSEQRERLTQAETAARHDALTGLANRAALGAYADAITTAGLPCVVAILDVDHFKAVNDTYGHAAGDAVLVAVARRLEASCRSQRAEWPDLVGRWGGEEFVLLLPRLPADVAPQRVEAMRRAISATPVPWASLTIPVTASVGAVLVLDSPLVLADAVATADEALYAAKTTGRDRTVWHA